MISRLFRLTFVLFCVELGIFLLVLPWTWLWEHNYFLYRYPDLAPWLLDNHLRGLISGLGLLDIGLALWYAIHFRSLFQNWLGGPPIESPSRKPGSLTRGQTA